MVTEIVAINESIPFVIKDFQEAYRLPKEKELIRVKYNVKIENPTLLSFSQVEDVDLSEYLPSCYDEKEEQEIEIEEEIKESLNQKGSQQDNVDPFKKELFEFKEDRMEEENLSDRERRMSHLEGADLNTKQGDATHRSEFGFDHQSPILTEQLGDNLNSRMGSNLPTQQNNPAPSSYQPQLYQLLSDRSSNSGLPTITPKDKQAIIQTSYEDRVAQIRREAYIVVFLIIKGIVEEEKE